MASNDDVDPARFFAERLQELRQNAAPPLNLDDLAKAANAVISAEARRAGMRVRTPVSKQRLSAWSSGSNVPSSFDVLRAVLQALFTVPRREGTDPTSGLYNTRVWRHWWEEAQKKRTDRPQRGVPLDVASDAITAMHTLRADVADFTGRGDDLDELYDLLPAEGLSPSGPVVVAIDGMGGIGKTAFAFHAAHQLADHYPDVRWEVDLHGFDPGGQEPADPASVLADFLSLAGVPLESIPPTLDGRKALYRDRLAGQRVLIVLDNAINEKQVRPLLPAAPDCLVLVTSRNKLAGLEGAKRLSLKVFSEDDALKFFTRIVGAGRVQAEPAAAEEICQLTGHLAIAIRVAAGYLQSHPVGTLAAYVERLRDENRRLRALSAGDRVVSAVFALSYRPLSEGSQRLFRLMAVHPGEDATVYSVAALADLDIIAADEILEDLFNENLLQQLLPGRYRMHDLIRAYSHSLIQQVDTEDDRRHAVARVVGWYLYTARSAAQLLAPGLRPVELGAVPAPRDQLALSDYEQAMSWCDTERSMLVAAVSAADFYDLHTLTWRLACVLCTFYDLRKYWDDWISGHRLALSATDQLGDSRARAQILTNLASAHWQMRNTTEAIACCQRAIPLCRTTHDQYMKARALNNLGLAHWQARRFHEAIQYFKKSMPLRRTAQDRCGEGITLNNLGLAYSEVGRFRKAIKCYERALPLERETREQHCEGHTLNNLGSAYLALGDVEQALFYIHQALSLRRKIGDRWGPAETLEVLGQALDANGDPAGARASWAEAANLFDELGDAQAEQVRRRLTRIDEDS